MLFFLFFSLKDVEEDENILRMLSVAKEKETVIKRCMESIVEGPYSFANERIVRLLAEFKDAEALAVVVETENLSTELWDEITTAFTKLGPRAVDMIRHIIHRPDDDKSGYALKILADIPTQDAGDILLRNWEKLYLKK